MTDQVHQALLAALRRGLEEPGEHRLFRSGKLAGLFPSRTGAAGAAAGQAVRDRLLETTRTEFRGKAAIDWVKLTPGGIEFLHSNESPLAALRELQTTLSAARTSAPAWLERMQQQFEAFKDEMRGEMQKALRRLDALAERVEEALRRSGSIGPALPNSVAQTVPWAGDAVSYLDQRRGAGANDECPLPELFAALRRGHPDLSLVAFQDGLRRMQDHKAICLLPLANHNGAQPEPEYIMCDGPELLYYVRR
jgi:hypothetical protein